MGDLGAELRAGADASGEARLLRAEVLWGPARSLEGLRLSTSRVGGGWGTGARGPDL